MWHPHASVARYQTRANSADYKAVKEAFASFYLFHPASGASRMNGARQSIGVLFPGVNGYFGSEKATYTPPERERGSLPPPAAMTMNCWPAT